MAIAALIILIGAALLVALVKTGPRLEASWPSVTVPQFEDLAALADWLAEKERAVPDLIEGTEACIQFADPEAPARTPLCFVYIHGFSATWQETAPVTEQIAKASDANVLQARLAGHGTEPETMVTPAEDWLRSMAETFEIAAQLGDKIVIVATSTGAPLSVWLARQPQAMHRIHALLFMSPNFRIRSKFDFLLTAAFSRHWIHWLLGRIREWEPANELQARYWTYRYSTLALIEMQKAVDWVKRQSLGAFHTPLAIMYMENDPTIDPEAAIRAFGQWGAIQKVLIRVEPDGKAEDHVFCGDIVGSQRTGWVVDQFVRFLADLD